MDSDGGSWHVLLALLTGGRPPVAGEAMSPLVKPGSKSQAATTLADGDRNF